MPEEGRTTTTTAVVPLIVNGLPALGVSMVSPRAGVTDYTLLRVDVVGGQIAAIDIIIARDKR